MNMRAADALWQKTECGQTHDATLGSNRSAPFATQLVLRDFIKQEIWQVGRHTRVLTLLKCWAGMGYRPSKEAIARVRALLEQPVRGVGTSAALSPRQSMRRREVSTALLLRQSMRPTEVSTALNRALPLGMKRPLCSL